MLCTPCDACIWIFNYKISKTASSFAFTYSVEFPLPFGLISLHKNTPLFPVNLILFQS